MNTLCTHIWKEWREQRGLLLLFAIALPCLSLSAVMPFERSAALPGFVPLCTALDVLLIAIATASRSVGHELTGDGFALLQRLPRGLMAPFLAKLAFFMATLIGLGCYALASLVAARWLLVGVGLNRMVATSDWRLVLGAIAIAFALFAVSFWVPRSGWAPPACLVMLAILVAPVVWALYQYPKMGARLLSLQSFAPLVIPCLVIAAGWSFARGYRFGYSLRRARTLAGITVLFMVTPVSGWTAHEVHRWVHLDPTSPDTMIWGGFLSSDGRFAYLNYAQDSTAGGDYSHAIRVDLRDGTWSEDQGYAHYYENIGQVDGTMWVTGYTEAAPLIVRNDNLTQAHDVVDTASGKCLGRIEELGGAIIERVRDAKRRTTPIRLADGRRAWFLHGTLESVAEDGSIAALADFGSDKLTWMNGPSIVSPPGKHGEHVIRSIDLGRLRAFERPSGDWSAQYLLRDGWLVRKWNRERDGARGDWSLMDPDTGAVTTVSCLRPDDRIVGDLDQNRIWVLADRAPKSDMGHLVLVDVAAGTRTPLATHDDVKGLFGGGGNRGFWWHSLSDPHGEAWSIHEAGWPCAPVHTPDGRRIYLLSNTAGTCLVRFDEASMTLTPALGDVRAPSEASTPYDVLVVDGNDSVVVARNHRQLVRLWFGSDRCEVLFPRE